MRFYRNHPGTDEDCSRGYRWFATKGAALDDAFTCAYEYEWAGAKVAEEFIFSPTKQGFLALLRQFATYPDNG